MLMRTAIILLLFIGQGVGYHATAQKADSLLLAPLVYSLPWNISLKPLQQDSLPPLFRPPFRPITSPRKSLFGGMGLQFRLNGTAEIGASIRNNWTDNPNLTEANRRQQSLNLGTKIQLRAEAKVGRKLSLELGYDSEAREEQLKKRIRLIYRGDSSEVVQSAEVGQIAFTPQNSLMGTTRATFGAKASLQMGRVGLNFFLSRAEDSRSIRTTSGGNSTTQFSLRASDYDEGRHFFLSDYFRSHYDAAMAQRPQPNTGIQILRIEVWVTNKRGKYDDARHILAFADLAEGNNLHNNHIQSKAGNLSIPRNNANSIYGELQTLPSLRSSEQAESILPQAYRRGQDYTRLTYARLLKPEEYVLNKQLGYISLIDRLQDDEELAVAYEYSYRGEVYQVGELSSKQTDAEGTIYAKLLKGLSKNTDSPYWHYMMRQVYALGGAGLRQEIRGLQVNLSYESEEAGSPINYIPKGNLAGQRLIDVLGLDILNSQNEQEPDGRIDLIEGLTLNSHYGWLYLPSTEPFATLLTSKDAEEQYIYKELYDRSQTAAKEQSRKDKYILRGAYTSTLPSLSPAVQEQSATRQTLFGVDVRYHLSKQLSLGASAMYLSEQSLGAKVNLGAEPMQNSMWGINLRWEYEPKWIDRLLASFPSLASKRASRLSFIGELAMLNPNYQQGSVYNGYSPLDDFESSHSAVDLLSANGWTLGSSPQSSATQANGQSLDAGYHRAHLAWFSIDPIFTREQLGQMPAYLRRRPDLRSSHYVREIEVRELFPDKAVAANTLNYIPTLSLRYYPRERGMYNFDAGSLSSDGTLQNPRSNWASIQHSLSESDFEANNVEYLEFWLLDPYLEDSTARTGGELAFQIGEVSEDIIPDGRKAYEHGLSPNSPASAYTTNAWGKVSSLPTVGFAFDADREVRKAQDVGYNGLSSAEERSYPSYQPFLEQLSQHLTASTRAAWQADKHSPLNDPAGDDFTHYRSNEWDRQEVPILERYKYYNGVEGNSSQPEGYARISPDVEDINQDNKLNQEERYYEYAVSLRPEDLKEGTNYITASRESEVTLPDGRQSTVRWYQFRIPLSDYRSAVGGISSMKTMTSMRMVLRGFEEQTDLRFAALRLVKGEWRVYQEPLDSPTAIPSAQTKVTLGAISLEEHSGRKPINYVLPPEIDRRRSSIGGEMLHANEQALSIKVDNLPSGDARSVYKQGLYDLRYYKHLQLFTHAEQLAEHSTDSKDGDLNLFLRLGSDFSHNYYEYSLPLHLSQEGHYSNSNPHDRLAVWLASNMLDLDLEALPLLKARRNKLMQNGATALSNKPYTEAYKQSGHSLTILGNPSLSRIRSLMIGIRNSSGEVRSIEVWVNELRLSSPLTEQAWAAQGRLSLDISDLASLSLEGRHSTAGWGDITSRVTERSDADISNIQIRGTIDLGRFLGTKAKTTIPIQYNYSQTTSTPQYNPLDDDIRLRSIPKLGLGQQQEQYILGLSHTGHTAQALSISGLNIGIKSKTPMPYDPANLRLDYNYSQEEEHSPSLKYRDRLSWQLGLYYDYTTAFQALHPFSHIKGSSLWHEYLRRYKLQLWPDRISLQSNLSRQYEEEQLRSQIEGDADLSIPLSLSHQFLWQRKLHLSWTLIPNLRLNLTTGTDARIEAPNLQVNKRLNPDDYALWRDAVLESIVHLGSPQQYRQQSSAVYTLPTAQILPLSWLSGSLSYTSNYEWERGAIRKVQMPHTISSQTNTDYTLQLNFRRLYSLSSKFREQMQRGKNPLLAIQELSLSYRRGKSLYLPGFMGEIGDAFGQSNLSGGLRPGLDFAFGLADADYIRRAMERNWLTSDADLALSGIYTESKVFDIKMILQPIKGLNITLLGNHTQTLRHERQYQSLTLPVLYGGDMQMTTIGLRGIFSPLGSSAGYASADFSSFMAERQHIHEQLLSTLTDPSLHNALSLNNSAILIPAFRRTYTLGLGHKGLKAIPSNILSLLPNWTIDYNIGNKLPLLGKHIRSLTLRHAYRGIYRVHSYDSFNSWQAIDGSSLGLLTGDNNPTPRLSLREDISAVSLSEQLYPLIGIDVSLKNGITLLGQWRKSRTRSLGLSAERMIETASNEWNIGLSYQIADIRRLWRPSAKPADGSSRGLMIKADYSSGSSRSLIRLLSKDFTQATLGNEEQRMSLSLDYELSRALSLRAFYEWQYIRPLVSSTAYPTLLRSYGLSLKLNLSQ